jgi:ParB family transcriptional regulator, chromosome partitioning protein
MTQNQLSIEEALTTESTEQALKFTTVLNPGSSKKAFAGEKTGEFFRLAPSKILALPGHNPRVRDPAYDAHIEWVTQSIMDSGYYESEPVSVYVHKDQGGNEIFYVTEGHTRVESATRAIQRGKIIGPATAPGTIPVVKESKDATLREFTWKLHKANRRMQLTPYEDAIVAHRLIEQHGETIESVAAGFGVTPTYVRQLLTVIKGPVEIQRMVQTRMLTLDKAHFFITKYREQAVAILQGAEDRAKADGKTRIAAKYLPGAAYTKGLKKQAPALAETLRSVKADPAYASLAPDLRKKLDELDQLLANLEESNAPDDEPGDAASESGTT